MDTPPKPSMNKTGPALTEYYLHDGHEQVHLITYQLVHYWISLSDIFVFIVFLMSHTTQPFSLDNAAAFLSW